MSRMVKKQHVYENVCIQLVEFHSSVTLSRLKFVFSKSDCMSTALSANVFQESTEDWVLVFLKSVA